MLLCCQFHDVVVEARWRDGSDEENDADEDDDEGMHDDK